MTTHNNKTTYKQHQLTHNKKVKKTKTNTQ